MTGNHRDSGPFAGLDFDEVRREGPAEEAVGSGRFRATDTPCVGVCSTLYDEICRGCGRTAAEVSNWVFFTEAEKRVVWERITAQGYPRRNA